MKQHLKTILAHPVTYFNILTVGVLIMIGMLHNHAHYSMDKDPDAYVLKWCQKNPEKCEQYLRR